MFFLRVALFSFPPFLPNSYRILLKVSCGNVFLSLSYVIQTHTWKNASKQRAEKRTKKIENNCINDENDTVDDFSVELSHSVICLFLFSLHCFSCFLRFIVFFLFFTSFFVSRCHMYWIYYYLNNLKLFR